MDLTEIRADILDSILTDIATDLTADISSDHDNIIIVTDGDGKMYKLTIERL